MSDFVFYPVIGNGLSLSTAFTWQTGTINYNTPSDWASVPSFTTLTIGTLPTTGTVPDGAAVNAGFVAGNISPSIFQYYTANPSLGDPYIASNNYPVDVLLNSGSVELNNLMLTGFNEFAATDQFPTLDVEGATLAVMGAVVDTGIVTFPTIQTPLGPISSATASGGGTIDIGNGASVALDGAVPNDIIVNFNDTGNTLDIGVSPATNTFAGTITGPVTGNTLLLPNVPLVASGVTTTASFNVTTGVLQLIVDDPTTIDLHIPNFSTLSGPVPLIASGDGIELVTCFARGTRIATPNGQVPIEQLCVGDLVLTVDGKPEQIKWIGRRSVNCRAHPQPKQVWPIRIRAHALAANQPERDLLVSPQHAIFAENVLIPAWCLVNSLNVTVEQTGQIEYFHIELPRHDVVLAEGLPTETYLDNGDRANFENGGPAVRLHPDFTFLTWEARGYAPLTVAGPEVDSVRALLEARHQLRSRNAAPAAAAYPDAALPQA